MQRIAQRSRLFTSRAFSTSPSHFTAWSPGPSPPRLPEEEQKIFDDLQRQSTGAFSTPRQPPTLNQSPLSGSSQDAASIDPARQQTREVDQSPDVATQSVEEKLEAKVRTGSGEELHPNIRRGAPPEFQGDVNPKTGEAGGPKNEPLRWGHEGDWSYNGRVTDF